MVKKLVILVITSFILISIFSVGVSGIKIWPGKLWIDVNTWYDDETRVNQPKIQIINTESYDVEIAFRVDNPSIQSIDEGYSFIPDTSWVYTDPDYLIIPAGESEFVDVYIDVPKHMQSLHYNEKWEALVVITPPIKSGGGVNIQMEIAVKLYISTPEGEAGGFEIYHIFLVIFIFLFIGLIISSYTKKKSRKSTVYFFKKKRGHSP